MVLSQILRRKSHTSMGMQARTCIAVDDTQHAAIPRQNTGDAGDIVLACYIGEVCICMP